MGGEGSGVRKGRRRRRYVEELEALDIRDVSPRALRPWVDLRWKSEPLYRWAVLAHEDGQGVTVLFRGQHAVRFTGRKRRPRFLCECGRLVMTRYRNDGISWGCRQCLGLAYSAQRGVGFDHWDTACRASLRRQCCFRNNWTFPAFGPAPPHLTKKALMRLTESWEYAYAERMREWIKLASRVLGIPV